MSNLIIRACLLVALVVVLLVFPCIAPAAVEYYAFVGMNTYYGDQIAGGFLYGDFDAFPDYCGKDLYWYATTASYNGLSLSVDSFLGDGRFSPEFRSHWLQVWDGWATSEDWAYLPHSIGFMEARLYMTGCFDGLNECTPARSVFSALSYSSIWSPDGPGIAIENPIFSRITAQDVFSNKKSLSYNVTGERLIVKFSPTINVGGLDIHVPLSVAERLFEVDHFNWINEVTLPDGWQAEIHTGSQLLEADQPLIDPLESFVARYVLTNADGEKRYVGVDFVPDDAPYYYNEGGGGYANIDFWTVRDEAPWPDSLSFTDAPTSSILVDPIEKFSFRTELVGVPLGGGEPVHTGIGVTWRSNAANVSDVERFSAIDPEVLPPVVSGGVFDVEVFGVPEPSTFVLFGIGAISLLAFAWRPSQVWRVLARTRG